MEETATLMAAQSLQLRQPRARVDRDVIAKRDRALKAHLTETELEMARTRVNQDNVTIHDVVDKELIRVLDKNENLKPSFWSKTLEEFKFGVGIWHLLVDDANENEPLDPELKAAVEECYSANPAKRKSLALSNFLETCESMTRRNFGWLCCKSVEQTGLLRPISDQMLNAILKFISRFLCILPYDTLPKRI